MATPQFLNPRPVNVTLVVFFKCIPKVDCEEHSITLSFSPADKVKFYTSSITISSFSLFKVNNSLFNIITVFDKITCFMLHKLSGEM